MSKHPIRAILFDMDGVLTDTEKYYNKAIVQTMHEMGYRLFPGDESCGTRGFPAAFFPGEPAGHARPDRRSGAFTRDRRAV